MKKLNLNFVLKKLKEKNIKIFSVLDFQRAFGINYELAKKTTLRYSKKRIFVRVKKGLYFLAETPPSEFALANKLYQPSYISFETALSFYGIIPETIYEIISTTSRARREFKIGGLKFSFKTIKKECYLGYTSQKIKNETILIAEPEKSLADYLYFVSLKKRELSYERINLGKIKKQKLINYAKCFQNKKLLELIKELYHD